MRGLVPAFIALAFFIPQLATGADGGSFLRIGVGARALGMGGAFVALADDPTAIYWNPAGLVHVKFRELSSMYTNQFGLGVHYSFLAYSQPWGKQRAWAAGLVTLLLGDIPVTALEEYGRPVVIRYTASAETALMVAYAQMFFRTSLGVTLKGIRQTLAGATSLGMGIDIGARLDLFPKLPIGMVLRTGFVHWSTGERSVFPGQMVLGMVYRPFPRLALALDAGLQAGRRVEVHTGVEYLIFPQLGLRLGLDRGRLTLGTGVAVMRFKFDYAITFHALGISHRLSFGTRF